MGTKNTRLTFITDGSFVEEAVDDPLFSDYAAIIIDEAHERNIIIDIIMYLLRENIKLQLNPYLKIIIMSATISVNKFRKYFSEVTKKIGIMHISGHTHKVDEYWSSRSIDLDWKNLSRVLPIMAAEKAIEICKKSKSGDILVFLYSKGSCQKAQRIFDSMTDQLKEKVFSSPFWSEYKYTDI